MYVYLPVAIFQPPLSSGWTVFVDFVLVTTWVVKSLLTTAEREQDTMPRLLVSFSEVHHEQ